MFGERKTSSENEEENGQSEVSSAVKETYKKQIGRERKKLREKI